MNSIGRIFGVIALLGLLIGFIPLFGWINWLNIPFALIGLVFSILGKSSGSKTICLVAIFLGLLRLILGGGLV